MHQKVDFLVIGGGIAGTVFAWEAMQRGCKVHIAELPLPGSASRVAGGLINPVTGRFLKKSWLIDDLLPDLQQTYRAMEDALKVKVLHELPILRMLPSMEDVNNWEAKRLEPEYADYLSEMVPVPDPRLKPHAGCGVIKQGFWLDSALLLNAFRYYMQAKGDLSQCRFSPDEVQGNVWNSVAFRHIVFCEGIFGNRNHWFPDLPLRAAKGEVMIVKIEGADFPFVVNKNMLLIPLGSGRYKVGATFAHSEDVQLSDQGLQELTEKLLSVINVPFDIESRQAGLRPTVKDRRPLLGRSKFCENAFIFNGLGTKGVSLAPYFARHLLAHVLDGQALRPEVDIARFG